MNHHAPGGPRPDDTVASPPRRRPGDNPFAGLALLLAVAGVVPALRTIAWVLAGLSGALAVGYAAGRAGAGRAQLGIAVGVVVLTFLATPPPNRAAYRGEVAGTDTVAPEPDAAEAAPEPEPPESDEAPPEPRPAERRSPEPPPAERVAAREPDRPRERPRPKATPRAAPKSRPAPAASRTAPKAAAPRTRRTPPRPAEVATRSTPRTTEPRAPRTAPRRTPEQPVEAPARREPVAAPRRTPPPVAAPSARELSDIRGELAVARVLKNQGAYQDAGVALRNAQQSVAALSARYPGSPAVSEMGQRVRILANENRRACFAEAAILRARGEAASPCP